MPVTNAEKASYDRFVREELARLSRKPQDVLWHYTSGDALIKIIESRSVWLTQISCLNDYSEMRYSIALLRQAFQTRRANTTPSPDEQYLYERIDAGLAVDVVPSSEWFVFCLSERADDLSQWRAYAGGEGGYSIGFYSQPLLTYGALPDGHFLAPVTYSRTAHAALTNAIVTATLAFFNAGLGTGTKGTREQWVNDFLPAWSEALAWFIPVLKDDAFEAEREWRIVHRLAPDELTRMKYIQRRMMMSRHLPIEFPAVSTGKALLPIAQIIVGPSRFKPISRVSVDTLLLTHGYTTRNVTESRLPFQLL
jgi:hypothetical protein